MMKTVFTNGCFDVLHIGHIQSLKMAKSFGDKLIVGLNTDRSVRALKGEGHPIMPENERQWILGAIRYVDQVILFDEDTPEKLIQEIKPDVLVKGEDYRDKHIAGAEFVTAQGGAVILLPIVEGISTSGIIEIILENFGK